MSKELAERNVIAVCCATLREMSVLEPIDAICKAANERGLVVQIFQSFDELDEDNDLNRGAKSVFELIDYHKICGLILFGERLKDQELIQSLIDKAGVYNVPVVSLDQWHENCFNVMFDYADAFEDIVRHLVEYHKFRKFFVMAGVENNAFSEERVNVIRKVFEENGLALKQEDIAYGGFWELPTKEAMAKFWAEGRELPEAFICLNDTMATVIIDEIQNHGYRVPQDVVVTGFDGIFLAEDFVPKITTAKQQLDVAGEKAVQLIAQCMEKQDVQPYDTAIPFKMMIRQSCGCQRVDLSGVTGKIRGLHSEYDDCRRFGNYMDEMTRKMVAKCSVHGLQEECGYAHFVDNHDYIFIGVLKSILKLDEDFHQKICSQNPLLAEEVVKDMAVPVWVDHGEVHMDIVEDFSRKTILPDLDNRQKTIKNLLITAIHVGKEVYGHAVMDYKIGNREVYKTKMFINKISLVLFILKQQGLLTAAKNELGKMYVLDQLTGIYNRHGFYQRSPEFLQDKSGGYITVLSVDLDRLKPINDSYGHQEGDFAIKALSECLAEMVGNKGIYARFGGDEFVALMYQEDLDSDITNRVWKDMMHRLEKKKEIAKKPYQIQCSLGAVQKPWSSTLDIEDMIKQSDKYLYEMKRQHHEALF